MKKVDNPSISDSMERERKSFFSHQLYSGNRAMSLVDQTLNHSGHEVHTEGFYHDRAEVA